MPASSIRTLIADPVFAEPVSETPVPRREKDIEACIAERLETETGELEGFAEILAACKEKVNPKALHTVLSQG